MEPHLSGLRFELFPEGVLDRLGLLEDLLEHEVGVTPLLGGLPVQRDRSGLAAKGDSLEALQGDPCGAHESHLTVAQDQDLACLPEKRRDVRGHEPLPLPAPDDERRAAAAHRNQRLGEVFGDADDREGSPKIVRGTPHGGRKSLPLVLFNEVRDHLRVGPRAEVVPLGAESPAQIAVILDDPVVHDGDAAGAVEVRMGV